MSEQKMTKEQKKIWEDIPILHPPVLSIEERMALTKELSQLRAGKAFLKEERDTLRQQLIACEASTERLKAVLIELAGRDDLVIEDYDTHLGDLIRKARAIVSTESPSTGLAVIQPVAHGERVSGPCEVKMVGPGRFDDGADQKRLLGHRIR